MTVEPTLPDGAYVTWRGKTYRGSGGVGPGQYLILSDTQEDPEFTPGRVRGWRRLVPTSEATYVSLATRCTWRGEPFWVLSRSDPPGELLLTTDQVDPVRAEELGLRRTDAFAWEVTVPESEVTDLEQVRTTA